VEREMILRVIDHARGRHIVCYVWVLIEEFLESQSWDVYQVHHFFFSQLKVGDFICQELALVCKISILLDYNC
jgi:hypothetical protein